MHRNIPCINTKIACCYRIKRQQFTDGGTRKARLGALGVPLRAGDGINGARRAAISGCERGLFSYNV